jgi:hypothetical protein
VRVGHRPLTYADRVSVLVSGGIGTSYREEVMGRQGFVVSSGRLTTTRRILGAHAAMWFAGSLLLWWLASPLYLDEMSSLTSVSWPLLWAPALSCAGVSGTVAGLSIRRRWPWWVPGVVLVLVSMAALYVPCFFVARWPGSTLQETNLTDLIAALLGWTLYEVVSIGLAVAIGRQGRGHLMDEPTTGMRARP